MSYAKTIVCLADSFKPPHGRCVAGREMLPDGRFGGWIRPISKRPKGELTLDECSYLIGAPPRLLDILELKLESKAAGVIQAENHFIAEDRRWIKKGELPWSRIAELSQTPWGLWGDSDHTLQGKLDCIGVEDARQFLSSLLLIRVDCLTIQVSAHPSLSQPTWRGIFVYQKRVYNFSITDPVVRIRYGEQPAHYTLRDVYLCLSLGEPYEKDNRCHKLIAGVIERPGG